MSKEVRKFENQHITDLALSLNGATLAAVTQTSSLHIFDARSNDVSSVTNTVEVK